jgi:hypothetical protein
MSQLNSPIRAFVQYPHTPPRSLSTRENDEVLKYEASGIYHNKITSALDPPTMYLLLEISSEAQSCPSLRFNMVREGEGDGLDT